MSWAVPARGPTTSACEDGCYCNRKRRPERRYLLCPGRGGGGGFALVVGSNLPPFLGSYVPFFESAMVIPLTSRTTAHAIEGTNDRVQEPR
jgi:hypothetical protein